MVTFRFLAKVHTQGVFKKVQSDYQSEGTFRLGQWSVKMGKMKHVEFIRRSSSDVLLKDQP